MCYDLLRLSLCSTDLSPPVTSPFFNRLVSVRLSYITWSFFNTCSRVRPSYITFSFFNTRYRVSLCDLAFFNFLVSGHLSYRRHLLVSGRLLLKAVTCVRTSFFEESYVAKPFCRRLLPIVR